MFRTKVLEKMKTHILCPVTFFYYHAIYEVTKNIVESGRPQITVWHMCIVCWIPKATYTHSEYVILIAFHCNSGCTNALQCNVTCTLPVSYVIYTYLCLIYVCVNVI